MNTPTIEYPRGSGGRWLSNLIWHLEYDQSLLPDVDVVFDFEKGTDSFIFTHGFELSDGKNPVFYQGQGPRVRFSSPCWFNQYINDAIKVRYHIKHLEKESILDQFHLLTDSAIYILTDPLWQKTWSVPGELEYRLLLEDPDQFINCLFSVLDRFDIKYTKNRNYCYRSILYYISTCPAPKEHLNNFNSLLWLSWCHAHILINKQSLSTTLAQDSTVDSIRSIVEPASKEIATVTLPMLAVKK